MTTTVLRAEAWHREVILGMLRKLLLSGGEILPTERNIVAYGRILDAYLENAVPGAALVAIADGKEVGFTMAGELPDGLETIWGRVAMGWGTFVEPEYRRHGIASSLRRRLDDALLAAGFDTVLGGYADGNEAAEASLVSTGFKIFQHLGAKRLRET